MNKTNQLIFVTEGPKGHEKNEGRFILNGTEVHDVDELALNLAALEDRTVGMTFICHSFIIMSEKEYEAAFSGSAGDGEDNHSPRYGGTRTGDDAS